MTGPVETSDFGAFARRIVRAYGRRVASGEIEGLADLVALREAVDDAISHGARSLHDGPYRFSWTEIARALGVSRQAARQRFGGPVDARTGLRDVVDVVGSL